MRQLQCLSHLRGGAPEVWERPFLLKFRGVKGKAAAAMSLTPRNLSKKGLSHTSGAPQRCERHCGCRNVSHTSAALSGFKFQTLSLASEFKNCSPLHPTSLANPPSAAMSLTPPGPPEVWETRFFAKKKRRGVSHTSGAPRRCERRLFPEKKLSLTPPGRPGGVRERHFFLQKKKASLTPPGGVRDAFFQKRNCLSHLWGAPEVWERHFLEKKASLTPPGRPGDLSSKRSAWPQNSRIAHPSTQPHWQTHPQPQCLSHLRGAPEVWETPFLQKKEVSLTPFFSRKEIVSHTSGAPRRCERETFFLQKKRCLSHLRGAPEVWERHILEKKASLTPPGGVRDAFFQKSNCLSHLWGAPEVWERHFLEKKASLTPPGRPGGVREAFSFKEKTVSLTPPGRPGGVRDAFFQKKKHLSHLCGAPRCERDIFCTKKKCLSHLRGAPEVWETPFSRKKCLSHLWGAPEVRETPFFLKKKASLTPAGRRCEKSLKKTGRLSHLRGAPEMWKRDFLEKNVFLIFMFSANSSSLKLSFKIYSFKCLSLRRYVCLFKVLLKMLFHQTLI